MKQLKKVFFQSGSKILGYLKAGQSNRFAAALNMMPSNRLNIMMNYKTAIFLLKSVATSFNWLQIEVNCKEIGQEYF